MTEMKVYILVLTFIEIAVFEMQGLQSMAELNQNSCLQLQRKFFCHTLQASEVMVLVLGTPTWNTHMVHNANILILVIV